MRGSDSPGAFAAPGGQRLHGGYRGPKHGGGSPVPANRPGRRPVHSPEPSETPATAPATVPAEQEQPVTVFTFPTAPPEGGDLTFSAGEAAEVELKYGGSYRPDVGGLLEAPVDLDFPGIRLEF